MTYYQEKDFEEIKSLRKKALIGLFSIIATLLILTVGFILWYVTLPYESPKITTLKLINYPILAVFVIILFIYVGIYYRRIRRRFLYERNMLSGIRETSTGTFLENSSEIQDKDGVEFKALIFIEWNKYKKDFFERKVLVFNDKPFPEIPEDARVSYTTQSNVLMEYEILESDDETAENKKTKKNIVKEEEVYFD